MFWGLLFIAVGIILLLNYLFGLHLPVLRTLFALFLIYLGVKMLFGGFGIKMNQKSTETEAIFSSAQFSYSNDHRNFSTIFGESQLDLSSAEVLGQSIQISTVFGSTKVLLPSQLPVRVRGKVAFGRILFPSKDFNSFGETTFTSESYNKDQPAIEIEASESSDRLFHRMTPWILDQAKA